MNDRHDVLSYRSAGQNKVASAVLRTEAAAGQKICFRTWACSPSFAAYETQHLWGQVFRDCALDQIAVDAIVTCTLGSSVGVVCNSCTNDSTL